LEAWLKQYGLLLVFGNVLGERLGVPVPVMPTLIAAGAFAAQGEYPFAALAALALAGCVIGDGAWYMIGRIYGDRVLKLLCSISLSLDSCVRQTSIHFERWGGLTLVVGKFLPALGTVGPPMAGVLGTSVPRFLAYSTFGSALWVAAAIGAGALFQEQVNRVIDVAQENARPALTALAAIVGLYIALKWWQRRRFYRAVNMARISVQELRKLMDGGSPVIVDLRPGSERARHGTAIPGALPLDLAEIEQQLSHLSKDRDIVFYCSCPNEASAASAAKLLMDIGYRRVRPLLGGIDAWSAAGFSLETLQVKAVAPLKEVTS
jgi:membrane protein DedA with SNARE-associated domain/rhodanese-related sulfurtransferase